VYFTTHLLIIILNKTQKNGLKREAIARTTEYRHSEVANLTKQQPMKHNRNGQAEILKEDQLEELLNTFVPKHKLLFAICYYTSCRISEALKLERSDFISDRIIFRAATTKTKRTREVKIPQKLAQIIEEVGLPAKGYLFPSPSGNGHMTRQAADKALRHAADYIGLQGVSTHSFRRTGITKLHDAGIPLRTLQQRTGHASLANLALYVEVNQADIDAAGELL
jgi:integrase/recombinase XerD